MMMLLSYFPNHFVSWPRSMHTHLPYKHSNGLADNWILSCTDNSNNYFHLNNNVDHLTLFWYIHPIDMSPIDNHCIVWSEHILYVHIRPILSCLYLGCISIIYDSFKLKSLYILPIPTCDDNSLFFSKLWNSESSESSTRQHRNCVIMRCVFILMCVFTCVCSNCDKLAGCYHSGYLISSK
jgi:hypothetical protein